MAVHILSLNSSTRVFDKRFFVIRQSVNQRSVKEANAFQIIYELLKIKSSLRNQGAKAGLWPCIFCRSIVALGLSIKEFL